VSASHCILLPVDTPLFIHVKRALDCFLPRRLAGKITTEVFEPRNAPNDAALAKHLHLQSTHPYNNKRVIGGICDAGIAGKHNLDIYGGIVKRLAFAILSPTSLPLNNGVIEPIRVIYAHGHGQPGICSKFESSNSAQSLAKCIACHLNQNNTTIISPFAYGTTPDLKGNDWLLITSDIGWACNLSNSNSSLYLRRDAASLFPEWSRLLLSGLVLPANASPESFELLEEAIQAIHQACLAIRFSADPDHLAALLRQYYSQDIKDDSLAMQVALFLKDQRFIPSDIEPSKYGAQLAAHLWNPEKMSRYTLMTPEQRFRFPAAIRDGDNNPLTVRNNYAWKTRRGALLEAFEGHSQTRQTAGLNTDSIDLLILAPTANEYYAITGQFGDLGIELPVTHECPARECLIKITAAFAPFLIIVVCMEKMGRVNGALMAYQEIRRWRPENILLTGIAGGIEANGAKLGDIIIVNKVIDYELQKISEQKLPPAPIAAQSNPLGPPKVEKTKNLTDSRNFYYDHYEFNDFLVRCAINIARDGRWLELLPSGITRPESGIPKCHTEADKYVVLCGDKVIASRTILKQPLSAYPKAIAVEMEGAGVGAAVKMQGLGVRYLMIRAISDLANRNNAVGLTLEEESIKDHWRRYACHVAGAFTRAFVDELIAARNQVPRSNSSIV
jgi:nucleoside phosphorylase